MAATAAAQEVTVEQVQAAIAAKGASWTAADNEVARLHRQYGWYPANLSMPVLTGKEQYFSPLGTEELPTYLDWRDMDGNNYISKVKNQQSCGSCWAFATVGPIEAHIAIQENWPDMDINLSEQMLVSCCNSAGCNGCDGGFTTSSFDFAVTPGLVDEECYKQNDTEPCVEKCGDWADRVFKIDSWEIIGEGAFGALLPPPEDIMAALQYGPVGVGLAIYPDFYDYESGIYTTVLGIPEGFHAVTIVGYDSVEGYWICKNSWGSFWGEDGYFNIKWGAAFIGAITPTMMSPMTTTLPVTTTTINPRRLPNPRAAMTTTTTKAPAAAPE
jgi:C1A family cysteine protease